MNFPSRFRPVHEPIGNWSSQTLLRSSARAVSESIYLLVRTVTIERRRAGAMPLHARCLYRLRVLAVPVVDEDDDDKGNPTQPRDEPVSGHQ